MLVALLLLGCSCGTSGEDQQPGAEVTDVATPTEEPSTPASPTEDGGQQTVALELPGLPIGGPEVVFDEPSVRCASVNVSGDPLPAGVWVVVTGLSAPPQFTSTGAGCDDLPACLGGHRFTADSGGCSVEVAWNGDAVQDGVGLLSVSSATATCADAATCAALTEQLAAVGNQTIDLVVPTPDTAAP